MMEESIFRTVNNFNYQRWVQEFDTLKGSELEFIDQKIKALTIHPNIGILPISIPGAANRNWLKGSLDKQIYRNWHILSSNSFGVRDLPAAGTEFVLPPDLIAKLTKSAAFILPLPLNAILRRHALAQFILALAEVPDADILYADEDILQNGKRSGPRFKTDWDPYLILGRNYIGIPTLYRSEAILRVNPAELRSRNIDNLLYALTLRVCAATAPDKIVHIPSILCHRTEEPDWNGAEARKVVLAHLAEQRFQGVEISPAFLTPKWNRVRFPLPDPPPLVSIIVPTRDRPELIGPCVDGILNHTDYPALEVIVVDNGTTSPEALAILNSLRNDRRARVLRDDRPFNYSQLNNFGATLANGKILVLLNNDIQILHADWLTELASLASRPDIGAVGAKLLYPDFRVQHAGVSFGPNKTVLHQMRFAQRHETGPTGELALLRCTSAVTGACLALRKNLYFEVGGLNENRLRVAYNDVDLCRRIARKGLVIVWTPFAELLHHESVSRGLTVKLTDVDREATESMAFWSMNPEFYEHPDPFHNPQIEFQVEYVDFARPPRPHRFRLEFTERQPMLFHY
jgi:GT2 family glycosyltransferase